MELTKGQWAVFDQLMRGQSRGEIALALGVSRDEVKRRASSIYRRVGVENRIALWRHAVAHRVIPVPRSWRAMGHGEITPVQRAILRALPDRWHHNEVAMVVGIAPKAVQNQLCVLYRRTGTHSPIALLCHALECGWVSLEELMGSITE